MAKTPFLERLADHQRPLLADGAMGTMLHSRGAPDDGNFEQLNLTQPDLVAGLHRDYIQAGADLIETNTFGANRYKLGDAGLEDQVWAINHAGASLARRIVDASGRDDVYVAGSVGPLGVGLQPYGRTKPEDAHTAFAEHVAALADGGVDVLLFETFTDVNELREAITAARDVAPSLPIIAQMTFAQDDRTLLGDLPGAVARQLVEAGADVIGVNCSGGPAQISRILQAMRNAAPTARVSAMPNAGFPHLVSGRTMYSASDDYFAESALTLKAIGASIVGGCCGTTPEYIAAMRAALDDPSRPLPHVHFVERDREEEPLAPEHPTEMAQRLARGQFTVSVEMAPPRGYSLNKLLASAQLLHDAGANIINVSDSPTARMRMSPWAVCHLLQTNLGMEPILHFPTRGRNLLRIQGDLLGAHALGLRNLFVCMGDPTRIGDYPEAMDNYDIAPTGLIKLINSRLNEGLDQAGNSIGQPTTFNIGCALNMGADDLDKEIALLRKKIESGANFALGQATFDPSVIERFLRRYEQLEGHALTLPVIIGVMPLYSLKHATFLHNEVPGIVISDAIFDRIRNAGDQAAHEGVKIAQELLMEIKGMLAGAYIVPAFGRYELAAEVIDALAVAGSR